MSLGLYVSDHTGRRRQGNITATGANIGDGTITSQDQRYRAECEIASDTMLRRMIETGHHWLTPEQTNAICLDKGWGHLAGPVQAAA